MGESTAVYEQADRVADLTDRIRREHPHALQLALGAVTELDEAIVTLNQPASHGEHVLTHPRHIAAERCATLRPFVMLWLALSDELGDNAAGDATANDIITAALYCASGIDWAAAVVTVKHTRSGRFTVEIGGGDTSTIYPVCFDERHG